MSHEENKSGKKGPGGSGQALTLWEPTVVTSDCKSDYNSQNKYGQDAPWNNPQRRAQDQLRENVSILIATGRSIDEIAKSQKTTKEKLEELFGEGLLELREQEFIESIKLLKAHAEENPGSAATWVKVQLAALNAQKEVVRRVRDDHGIGKKEFAQEQAQTAGEGTEWGSDLTSDFDLTSVGNEKMN